MALCGIFRQPTSKNSSPVTLATSPTTLIILAVTVQRLHITLATFGKGALDIFPVLLLNIG